MSTAGLRAQVQETYKEYERLTCRGCGQRIDSVATAMDLGVMAVSDFLEQPVVGEKWFPQELVRCARCALVQLRHTVPADKLFRQFWYRSGVTETMRRALKEVVEQGLQWKPDAKVVMDVGANDGTLLSYYDEKLLRVGFEPAKNLVSEAAQHATVIVPEYFSEKFIPQECMGRVDILTAIAMFYDLEDPAEFLLLAKKLLSPDGVLIVQMNYLGTMTVDNVDHEHLTYYSLTTFQELAERCGLVVRDVQQNKVNGGSLRFVLAKEGKIASTVWQVRGWEQKTVRLNEADWLRDFEARSLGVAAKLRSFICHKKSQGKAIWALGASTRGSTLLQFARIGKGFLDGVGERDERKIGRYTSGTELRIWPEEEMRKKAQVLVVLPWHFRDEIVEREKDYLARGGELVFPLPRVEVVTKQGVWQL